jgi:predicted O-methyltransferase YrrM
LIFQIKAYIKHFLRAKDIAKIEDVSLKQFLSDVLDEEKRYYAFLTLGMLRKKMLKDAREIKVVDLGAGSKKLNSASRVVKDIAKLSVKKSKYAEVLFRIVENQNIQTTIELGTSLGVTTSYLSLANKKGKVFTVEGCPETLKIASENFKEIGLLNVEKIAGNFDDHFPRLIEEHFDAGLVFIDGNHTKEATLRYFNQLLELNPKKLIIVFDDIHWSRGMEEAWNEIILNSKIQVSVDLYEMGIVIIDSQYKKGHYDIVI